MPAIIGASYYGTLRARDGVNYALLSILDGYLPFTVGVLANESFMTWGPGVDATCPGTRLYWYDLASGGVWRTNGAVAEEVPGFPVPGASGYTLYYDRAADVLYACYDGADVEVASFDGTNWTAYPATGGLGGTSGVVMAVPAGSTLRPGAAMVAT